MGRNTTDKDVSIAMEDLEDIPTEKLQWCFKQARKNNENVTPPNNGKVLKEHKVANNGGGDWNNTVKGAMLRRLDNSEAILNRNNVISVAAPGDKHSRNITAGEFINEAQQYLRN